MHSNKFQSKESMFLEWEISKSLGLKTSLISILLSFVDKFSSRIIDVVSATYIVHTVCLIVSISGWMVEKTFCTEISVFSNGDGF